MKQRLKDIRNYRIRHLFADGITVIQIANLFHLSRMQVYRILREIPQTA